MVTEVGTVGEHRCEIREGVARWIDLALALGGCPSGFCRRKQCSGHNRLRCQLCLPPPPTLQVICCGEAEGALRAEGLFRSEPSFRPLPLMKEVFEPRKPGVYPEYPPPHPGRTQPTTPYTC